MGWLRAFRSIFISAEQQSASRSVESIASIDIASDRLDRAAITQLIQRNDGPEGLYLADYDLSGLDLSHLNLTGVAFSRVQEGGQRVTARLEGTRFDYCNLNRANFRGANLERTAFWQTNLTEASLHAVRAQGCSMGKAVLRNADLYGADLSGANLWRADLTGANLALARFSDAVITDIVLGTLIQEDERLYKEYFDRWYVVHLAAETQLHHMSSRFLEAAELYMNLKNAYASNGRYRDASAAYLKERRLRRKTYTPWRVKAYYGRQVEKRHRFSLFRVWFYMGHFGKWLFDWVADITTGYGEKPFRAFTCATTLIVLFAFLFHWIGGVENAVTWRDYFNYSLASFSTIGFNAMQPTTPLVQTLTSIESLLGIALLALLMFTLGNRINRA